MLAHSLESAHRGRVCVCALIALVGYRVPAKPLRFELWGAREDLSPTAPCPNASQ